MDKDIKKKVQELIGEEEPLDVLRGLKEEEAHRLDTQRFDFYEPNGKCEQFIKKIGEGEHFVVLFSAANGVGKCLRLNAPILMANGECKQLKDVKIGDKVLGHNYNTGIAESSSVLQTSRAGMKDIYKITFKDGTSIETSPEHSFPMRFRSGRKTIIRKRRIGEILKRKVNWTGGRLKFIQPKEVRFQKGRDLPIHPYLLGALIGDGTIKRDVLFTNKDLKVVSKVKRLVSLEKGCQLKKISDIEYRVVSYDRNAKGNGKNILLNKIRQLELNVNSGDKFIPSIYKNASVKDRKQLLAGLIDTDGTFKEYLTKSKRLAEDFCFVVRSLGGLANLKAKIVNNSFTHFQDKTFYRIYWRFDYKLPLQIDRKQKVSKRAVDYSNRFVEDIKYIGKFQCGDIFIEHPYHCYVSHDFISTGNTCAGANVIAHICFDSKNQYFDYPLFKKWPFPKAGRIASDSTNIDKNLIPTLKEWLPKGRYKKKKKGKTYDSFWETDTGWEFDVMTYDQDAKEYEGATLGWAWFDEPPPEAIFKATVARMRKGGIIFISATPLKGSAWMYDHIIAQPEKDLAAKGQRCYIEADIEDACKQHGVRGHLEHEHILQMIAEYSEDEKQARVHGKFQHLIGLRFKRFSRNIHVIKPFEINLKDYAVYEALDTHPRMNDMASWVAIDRKGNKFIIDELWLKCQGGTEELAQRIKEKAEKYRIINRLLEPAAFIEDQHTQKCLAKTLSDYGLHYIKASKIRTQSDTRIEDALSFQQLGGSEEFIKKPELYIFDTCIRHIFEFEHFSWDDWTGKIAEKKGQKEKTIDKDDHSIENVGRILIREPVFVPKIEETELEEEENYDPFD